MGKKTVIGIDVGGTHMRSALVDSRCTILQRRRTTTEQSLGTAHVSHKLVLECRALVQEAAEMGASVAAVGLGVAGKIDAARGTVVFSPNLPAMRNFPLARELETGLGLPVTIENDANVFGLGESRAGAGRGIRNWIGITLGTGVGGCLILDGRLWQGDGLGFVGEIGHMIVWPGGSRCACGASGCLEAYASGRALVEGIRDAEARGELPEGDLHRLHTRGELTPEDVYRHALAGDALACSVFRTMGRALGLALTNLCTVLGLRNAVIGGGVSGSWDQFIEHLKESLAENARMFDPDEMVITRSLLGDDAALIGAAQTALGLEKV
ncbi:MAG: ROK family protein [Syntrophobacteraceae bacterium]|nr:ROK family protein [Syntrophobacteraceae bacterium]